MDDLDEVHVATSSFVAVAVAMAEEEKELMALSFLAPRVFSCTAPMLSSSSLQLRPSSSKRPLLALEHFFGCLLEGRLRPIRRPGQGKLARTDYDFDAEDRSPSHFSGTSC